MADNNFDIMNNTYLGIALKKSSAYTDQKVSEVREGISFVDSVEDLPAVGDPKTIYYVSTSTSMQDGVYDIYVWNTDTSQYVYRGTTQIDLDDYATDAELQAGLDTKIDKISTFPAHDAENIGKICQYVGTTDNHFTHGYFYEYVADANINKPYLAPNGNYYAYRIESVHEQNGTYFTIYSDSIPFYVANSNATKYNGNYYPLIKIRETGSLFNYKYGIARVTYKHNEPSTAYVWYGSDCYTPNTLDLNACMPKPSTYRIFYKDTTEVYDGTFSKICINLNEYDNAKNVWQTDLQGNEFTSIGAVYDYECQSGGRSGYTWNYIDVQDVPQVLDDIANNFVVDNGKLCYIDNGENGNDETSLNPLALDSTLQELVDAVEQIADNVSTVVESTVSTQVAEQLPSAVEDQISPIVEEQVADQIDDVVAAKLPAEVTRQISTPVNQAVNTYCAANFSEWQGGLDSTLTDSSMAAPADKVGAIKSALNDECTDIKNIFGTITYAEIKQIASSTVNNGIKGNVGSQLTETTSTSYWYGLYSIQPNQKYKFTTTKSGSSSYPNYVWYLDQNGVILRAYEDEGEYIAPSDAVSACILSSGSTSYKGSLYKIDYNTVEEKIQNTEELVEITNDKIRTIENKLPYDESPVNLHNSATITTGGVRGIVGNTITFTETSAYRYFALANAENKKFHVKTKASVSDNYSHYVIGVDSNNVITEKFIPSTGQEGFVEGAFYTNYNTSTIYVLVNANSDDNAYRDCVVGSFEIADIASVEYVDAHSNELLGGALLDETLKNTEIQKQFIYHISNDVNRTVTKICQELAAGTIAVSNKHLRNTPNLIRLSFITDTHQGGTRSLDYNPLYNIDSFVNVSNRLCDVAISGGDIITDYYDATYMPDVATAKNTISTAIRTFVDNLTIPFLPTKGNHDVGVNGYTAVSTPSQFIAYTYYVYDSETGTYYLVKDENEFEELVSHGATFYTQGLDLMSNQEYYQIALYDLPDGVVHGETYGGYYYYDVSDKLRIIVLNCEYVLSASSVGYNADQLTFLQNALSDAITNDLPVLTIAHKSVAGTEIPQYIRSFITNGGIFVGHIHGHVHQDTYSNSNGFSDIGVNWGCIKNTRLHSYNCAVYSIFEVDLNNMLLTEIRTGAWYGGDNTYRSVDRIFDYANQTQLV